MNRQSPSVVLKYHETFDQFVRVRVFDEDAPLGLIEAGGVRNERRYQRLVSEACILEFEEQVRPRLEVPGVPVDAAEAEDSLYHLCVEVNPHLVIGDEVVAAARA